MPAEAPELPENEELRLLPSERHEILDTSPKTPLDDLAELASDVLGAAMAPVAPLVAGLGLLDPQVVQR